MTRVLRTIEDVKDWIGSRRRAIGLVPTQGALHEGHGSLIRASVERDLDTIVSVFVNPIQFYPRGYHEYPRDEGSDIELARSIGASAVFVPDIEQMYPGLRADRLLDIAHTPRDERDQNEFMANETIGPIRYIRVPARLSMKLDGAHHPWHFDGVATVVARLFGICEPDFSFFGQKDVQQLAIIRALNNWLGSPTQIVGVPIMRNEHGVSYSSRLAQLAPDRRTIPNLVAKIMLEGASRAEQRTHDLTQIDRALREALDPIDGVSIDSVEVVHPESLESVTTLDDRAALYAAYVVDSLRLQECVLIGN